MDCKIWFYRRYFTYISDIGNEIQHRLSIERNIGEKSAKSAIYRRNIGLEPINREWSWRTEQPEEDFKKWPKISPVFLPIFREISRYFLPVQPAHKIQNLIMICRQRLCFSAWLKNRVFRVREIEIQWHNSKKTPKTDPENTGSKRKAIFLVFLGGFAWIF